MEMNKTKLKEIIQIPVIAAMSSKAIKKGSSLDYSRKLSFFLNLKDCSLDNVKGQTEVCNKCLCQWKKELSVTMFDH
uniref:Uncharacterized protein n=1 Tax=Rhizophora mucronata TaxID=61149 RepID=A0A2P2P6M5_RHIMU